MERKNHGGKNMIIYKITNVQNGKMYIGQTINSLEDRWKRHQSDALNNVIDTHFARAIRYYGVDNFITEIIDTAETQEELTKKEYYWINYYNAVQQGYNENDDGFKCGGNTYKNKTPQELAIIKEKLRKSKLGGNNPNATGVKCKNINTNEEYHFNSQSEMQAFFNETNHQFCSRRCRKEIKCLYKNEWLIAYEQDDYPNDYTLKGQTKRRGNQIKITELSTGKYFIFPSVRAAKQAIPQLPSREKISAITKGNKPQQGKYYIENIK